MLFVKRVVFKVNGGRRGRLFFFIRFFLRNNGNDNGEGDKERHKPRENHPLTDFELRVGHGLVLKRRVRRFRDNVNAGGFTGPKIGPGNRNR